MGSPLGPTLANLFIDHFEKKHMSKLNELGVIEWHRYVDDTFVVLKNKEAAEVVLNYLNNQHKNIKFNRIEYEKKNQLPFLDVLVVKKNNTTFTRHSTTRKPLLEFI